MPSPRYNPRGDDTNCGFCAVSYALDRLNLKWFNADDLYNRKLERLQLTPAEKKGFPRQLIFPERNWEKLPPRPGYEPLFYGTRSPSLYTITQVAQEEGLAFHGTGLIAGGHVGLTRDQILGDDVAHFFGWCKNMPGRWKFHQFVEYRLELLEEKAETTGTKFDAAEKQRAIMQGLAGDAILGSKKTNHFMNLHIDPVHGSVEAHDPQSGGDFDGKQLADRLGEVNLFIHLEKGGAPSSGQGGIPKK